MRLKATPLAAAVSAVIALGSAGEAAASVYGGSRLLVQNLVVLIQDNEGNPVPASSFNFSATNAAVLNSAPSDLQSATCSGTPGVPAGGTNNCNPQPNTGLNTAGTRLDPDAANDPDNDFGTDRPNNDFSFFGPTVAPATEIQFSSSDSVIDTAQLTGDASTSARQIAESELRDGENANASAQIQSNTGFTFTFDITESGSLTLSFEADPEMLASIFDPATGSFLAQADMTWTATIQQTTDAAGDTLDFVQWNPQGTAANDCNALNGPVCVETADSQDLNNQVNTAENGTSVPFSAAAGFTPFGISVTGLDAGSYSFVLSQTTSTLVTRQVEAVPEPGTLLLLGSGFAVLGIGGVRRQKKRTLQNAA